MCTVVVEYVDIILYSKRNRFSLFIRAKEVFIYTTKDSKFV